jgi:hypothetical protein
MKHDFAIEALGRSRRFGGARYRYFCVRCRWTFLTVGRFVAALDEKGEPLAQPVNAERVATFSDGPCPAAPDVVRPAPPPAEQMPPDVAAGARSVSPIRAPRFARGLHR